MGKGEPFYRETRDYVSALKTAGVEAEMDVYPSNFHAFDMLKPDEELSKQAIYRFNINFEKALNQ